LISIDANAKWVGLEMDYFVRWIRILTGGLIMTLGVLIHVVVLTIALTSQTVAKKTLIEMGWVMLAIQMLTTMEF
jgi:hypothetical protein